MSTWRRHLRNGPGSYTYIQYRVDLSQVGPHEFQGRIRGRCLGREAAERASDEIARGLLPAGTE